MPASAFTPELAKNLFVDSAERPPAAVALCCGDSGEDPAGDPGEDPSEAQAKSLVETFRHPDQIQVLMLVLLQEQFSRT